MRHQLVAKTPTQLILFGATGDLTAKKIVPALWHLYEKKKLPRLFQIVAFSHRRLSDDDFIELVKKILKHHKDFKGTKKQLDAFVKLFVYRIGSFNNRTDYQYLSEQLHDTDNKWGVCTNKLFYLAVPPQYYENIFKHLAATELSKPCSDTLGWTRLIVEKPFGSDLKTAQRLDASLAKLFRPEQIYPIDHYLGKTMVENILTFRFSNNLFEKVWDKKLINRIEVKVLEKFGIKGRGKFYDGVGALRDVGQNHLLQMLSLVTMSNPGRFDADSIRARRAEVLSTLAQPTTAQVKSSCYRAQYDGYTKERGVSKNSKTETYFRIRAKLNAPQWEGVPIILEHGKGMKENKKEIIIYFKHPEPCFCQPGKHFRNKIVFNIEPEEKIEIHFWANKPGFISSVEERIFTFDMHEAGTRQHIEEYEKLLHDAVAGDQTLFVGTTEVEAMWRFIDPIVRSWKRNDVPLRKYKVGSDSPRIESESLLQPIPQTRLMKKEIGMVGLGKMGAGLVRQLLSKGWRVVGYNRSPGVTKELAKEGMVPAYSLPELTSKLDGKKVVWVMVPAGKPVDATLFGRQSLTTLLTEGDTIIDGGNSNYKNTVARARKVIARNISFLDAGVSGGPKGARYGASMMVGGKERDFKRLELLFATLNVDHGYAFFFGHGAGHFVKMVHNGIEYGMMQAIAEGFDIMEKSKFKFNLHKVASVYSYGTVIESRLITLMTKAFEEFGNKLQSISGAAQESGEGRWTVETAHELNVPDKVLHEALHARRRSRRTPNFQGKIISALRNQFGGHEFKKGKGKKNK